MNFKRNRAKQVKAVHRNNLKENLKRRLEAGRNQGNSALIKQLNEEASYLHLDL